MHPLFSSNLSCFPHNIRHFSIFDGLILLLFLLICLSINFLFPFLLKIYATQPKSIRSFFFCLPSNLSFSFLIFYFLCYKILFIKVFAHLSLFLMFHLSLSLFSRVILSTVLSLSLSLSQITALHIWASLLGKTCKVGGNVDKKDYVGTVGL